MALHAASAPQASAFLRALAAIGNTRGRTNRTDYVRSIGTAAATALICLWLASHTNPETAPGWIAAFTCIVLMGLALAFALAASARRLHDIGQSGGWALLLLIPTVNLVMLLALCVIRGNEGPNRYGDPPASR